MQNCKIFILFSNFQEEFSFCTKRFGPNFMSSCFGWFLIEIEAHLWPNVYAPGAIINVALIESFGIFGRIRNLHFTEVHCIFSHFLFGNDPAKKVPFLLAYIQGSNLLFSRSFKENENNNHYG